MSQMFLVCLYAISGGWLKFGYLRTCLQKIFIFCFKMFLRTRIVEGWYRRFKISLSSSAVTWLFCNICCRIISLTKYRASFIMSLGIGSVGEEVNQYIGLLFEIRIIRAR